MSARRPRRPAARRSERPRSEPPRSERRRSEPRRPGPPRRSDWRVDLLILVGAFAVASALAGLFGAANLGTALTFGQIGFAAALMYVLLRRD